MYRLPDSHRKKLLEQLKRHEGAKRNKDGGHIAYRCPAGALTIGYGHNLDANPIPGLSADSVISEQRACEILAADVAAIAERLESGGYPWFLYLSPERRAVLLNMSFNLGISGLLGFRNTLADICAGNYASAAGRMLQSKWAQQVGARARELARQMEHGAWQF